MRRALFLGFVSLGFAGIVVASEQEPRELTQTETFPGQVTSERGRHDSAVASDLDLLGIYHRRTDEVIKFVMPFVNRRNELISLTDKLEEAKKDLEQRKIHDEKHEKQIAAVNRLLAQYEQEYEGLITVISIKYNKSEFEKDMELHTYYFDRCLAHARRLGSTTNK